MHHIIILNTIFNEEDNSFEEKEFCLPLTFDTLEDAFAFIKKSMYTMDFFLDSCNDIVIPTLTKIKKGE